MNKMIKEKQSQNQIRSRGPWKTAAKRFCSSPLSVAALAVLVIIIIMCLLAPVIATHNYLEIDLHNICDTPSTAHILGTDTLGRDLFSRMLYGGRNTLHITFCSLLLATAAGTLLGLAAGYYGGITDTLIMRVADGLASIPTILLAIVVECALGWGTGNYMYAMALAFTPPITRLLRTTVMSIMGSEYIEAARALGVSSFGIIMRHVLRNAASPLLIHISGTAAEALLMCTVIGYIGLGIKIPEPEWGLMVNIGYSRLHTSPHVALIPCFAVIICALCMNLIGNGLRDAFDSRSSQI